MRIIFDVAVKNTHTHKTRALHDTQHDMLCMVAFKTHRLSNNVILDPPTPAPIVNNYYFCSYTCQITSRQLWRLNSPNNSARHPVCVKAENVNENSSNKAPVAETIAFFVPQQRKTEPEKTNELARASYYIHLQDRVPSNVNIDIVHTQELTVRPELRFEASLRITSEKVQEKKEYSCYRTHPLSGWSHVIHKNRLAIRRSGVLQIHTSPFRV